MSNTTWTSGRGNGDWFGNGNWSHGVPTDSSNNLQTVVISGTVGPGPTISPTANGVNSNNVIVVSQALPGGSPTNYEDYQLDGQSIQLSNNATLTMQGVALGRPGGTGNLAGAYTTISGSAATSATPVFDTLMSITALGSNTAMFNDVNHNFGFLGADGVGNTLNVMVSVGGNAQSAHALFNYGEINASNRGIVGIDLLAPTVNGDSVGFYNQGWVLANQGTFIAASVEDVVAAAPAGPGGPPGGGPAPAGGTSPLGYVEISNAGEAILGTVAAGQDILFNGGVNNTLALSDAPNFAGTVVGFVSGQTIDIQGFSGPANISTTVVNGVTELLAQNGGTTNTVTLGGSIAPFFNVSTISQGGTTTEVISATAADYTFTGAGTTTSWFNPNNWAGGVSPGSLVNAGETVTIPTGTAAITGTAVTDNGLINVTGSTTALNAATSIAGNGTVFIDNGGHFTLSNTAGNDASLTVDFGTHGTSLAPNMFDVNNNQTGFGGTIGGFGINDQIVLGNSTEPTPTSANNVSLNYNSTTGELVVSDTVGGSIVTESLHLTGTFDTTPANTLHDSVGANGISVYVACFAEGTRILTSRGEIAVEALAVGDQVVTARKDAPATRPITWIGQRSIALDWHPQRSKVEPVRIQAGAFGDNQPARDLVVSPDHAIFVGNRLIEAKYLVNGASIRRDTSARRVHYYHIELDQHDVLIAEGLATESYINDGNRGMFTNGGEPMVLHPDFAATPMALRCAPLLNEGAEIEAIRAALRDRVMASGFTMTDALDASLVVGGLVLAPLASEPGLLRFALPDQATGATLHVATATPADTTTSPDDRRQIGLKLLSALVIDGVHSEMLNADGLDGLFDADQGEGRWSTDELKIDLSGTSGSNRVLELRYNATVTRWVAPVANWRAVA